MKKKWSSPEAEWWPESTDSTSTLLLPKEKPDRRGNTVMVLTPIQPMMRLASLIPPPHHPTRKYFGILAAGAKERSLVVPKPTTRKIAHCAKDGNRKHPL